MHFITAGCVVCSLSNELDMKDKFNQILIRYRPQLVDEIDCTELLNILISRNVLTRRQVKSIEVSLVRVQQEFKLCTNYENLQNFYDHPLIPFYY